MRTIKPATILVVAVVTLFLTGCTTATVYTSPDFEARRADHATVAVLPFAVAYTTGKQKAEGDDEETATDEVDAGEEEESLEALGRGFQEGFYTELLQDSGDYTVSFQDTGETNARLEQIGETHRSYRDMDAESLSKLAEHLEADVLLVGGVTLDRPASAGAAIASTLITGILSGGVLTAAPQTAAASVSVKVYDGGDGDLLWSFEDGLSGGIGNSPERLSRQLMKRIAGRFPYVAPRQ